MGVLGYGLIAAGATVLVGIIFWSRHKCEHRRARERRWLDGDGTPMHHWKCPDCGASDKGHVHADPKTWV